MEYMGAVGVVLGLVALSGLWWARKKLVLFGDVRALLDTPRAVRVELAPALPAEAPVAGASGFLVTWFDSGLGWIRGEAFHGQGAFEQACISALAQAERKTDALRAEARAYLKRTGKSLEMKPRQYFVLPVVVFETHLDASVVDG